MSTNNLKEKKALKEAENARDDVKLYRLMIEFGLVIVMIFLTFLAENNGILLENRSVLGVMLVISGVLFAGSAVWFTLKRNKVGDESMRIITTAGLFGNAAILFFSCLHLYLFWDAQMLTIALICAAVLYFIHNIYGGSYFVYSLITGVGFLALQIAGKSRVEYESLAQIIVKGALVLAFLLPVAAIVIMIIRFSKKRITKKTVAAVTLSSLLVLAGAVLTVVYPAGVIYAIFALLAFYLVTTIVYTVRMM